MEEKVRRSNWKWMVLAMEKPMVNVILLRNQYIKEDGWIIVIKNGKRIHTHFQTLSNNVVDGKPINIRNCELDWKSQK